MRLRVPLAIAIPMALLLAGIIILILQSPQIGYARRTRSEWEAARTLWSARGSASYQAIVHSNAPTEPTEGTNRIWVARGMVRRAVNEDCPSCPHELFASLTIEALFERIATECLDALPDPLCSVAYDDDLGFPRRIDTYPRGRDGQEPLSITVEEVVLLGPEP